MNSLRHRLVRLAYMNPGPIRDALLPLLKQGASSSDDVQGIFDGRPSDGGAWHGGPARFSFDFSSPGVEILGQSERGGLTTWDAKFKFAKTPTGYGSGAYAESFLFERHLKVFPGSERDILSEFMRRMRGGEQAQMAQHVGEWFKAQWYKPFAEIVGWNNRRDWDDASLIKVSSLKFGKKPSMDRFKRRIWLPVEVRATFSARKMADIEGPFTAMSDREMNKWIEKWESDAPENFWMDGELGMSFPQALAYYRKQWRARHPREQENMLNALKNPGY